MSAEVVVDVSDVSKSYRLGGALVAAVRGASFQLVRGEMVGLAGPSGSGKSTLLNLVGGLDRPDEGTIRLGDQRVSHLPARALAAVRRERLGFVFQAFNLLPVLTAAENVEYPLLLRSMSATARRGRVAELLDRVGLAGKGAHRPHQLSGGERQRVAVARALVNRPALVLADEPTANLDSASGGSVLDLMESLRGDLGVTFLIASHDPRLLRRMDRVLPMKDGALRDADPAETPQAATEEPACV